MAYYSVFVNYVLFLDTNYFQLIKSRFLQMFSNPDTDIMIETLLVTKPIFLAKK